MHPLMLTDAESTGVHVPRPGNRPGVQHEPNHPQKMAREYSRTPSAIRFHPSDRVLVSFMYQRIVLYDGKTSALILTRDINE